MWRDAGSFDEGSDSETGLVVKALTLVYHSTLGSRVMQKKKKKERTMTLKSVKRLTP